jgi:hypothetical protein
MGGAAALPGFVGSCTEASAEEVVCVDYFEGYTRQFAEDGCAQTGDDFSTRPCSAVNAGWSKIPGKCEINDTYSNPAGARSQASYYSPGFTEAMAHTHCDAYQSIPSFSSVWIAD